MTVPQSAALTITDYQRDAEGRAVRRRCARPDVDDVVAAARALRRCTGLEAYCERVAVAAGGGEGRALAAVLPAQVSEEILQRARVAVIAAKQGLGGVRGHVSDREEDLARVDLDVRCGGGACEREQQQGEDASALSFHGQPRTRAINAGSDHTGPPRARSSARNSRRVFGPYVR